MARYKIECTVDEDFYNLDDLKEQLQIDIESTVDILISIEVTEIKG